MNRYVCNNAAFLDNARQNISLFSDKEKFLKRGSITCSLCGAIRVILEASFQVLIYLPCVPRALRVIALALIFMLDELKGWHLAQYYPSLGHKSAIFQVRLGDFHTTPYLPNT